MYKQCAVRYFIFPLMMMIGLNNNCLHKPLVLVMVINK